MRAACWRAGRIRGSARESLGSHDGFQEAVASVTQTVTEQIARIVPVIDEANRIAELLGKPQRLQACWRPRRVLGEHTISFCAHLRPSPAAPGCQALH